MSIDDVVSHAHVESLEREIAALRSQLKSFEGRLAAVPSDAPSNKDGLSEGSEALLRDVPRAALDESDRVGRALIEAVAESLRSVADSVVSGLGAFDRQRAAVPAGETKQEPNRVGVDELATGIATGVLDAIGAQGRVIHRFVAAYDTHPPRHTARQHQSTAAEGS